MISAKRTKSLNSFHILNDSLHNIEYIATRQKREGSLIAFNAHIDPNDLTKTQWCIENSNKYDVNLRDINKKYRAAVKNISFHKRKPLKINIKGRTCYNHILTLKITLKSIKNFNMNCNIGRSSFYGIGYNKETNNS